MCLTGLQETPAAEVTVGVKRKLAFEGTGSGGRGTRHFNGIWFLTIVLRFLSAKLRMHLSFDHCCTQVTFKFVTFWCPSHQ